MPTLPERASLDWLKKTAKQNLERLRAADPKARLADAQRLLARDHGFTSWKALKAHVEAPPTEDVVAAFLRLVGDGETAKVRLVLAAAPKLVNAIGPHPYWGGRPQPLHVAIETKRREMFDLLLGAGADPSGSNAAYSHWSPLMLTFSRDQTGMRAELIARGARIGLVEALMMKDDARTAALLEEGLPEVVPNGGSLLAFARTPFAIDRLLALGASPTARDRWGMSPIEAMSRVGAEGRELVRHMMLRGVGPAPQEFARLGDRDALAVLAEADPAVVRADAVMMAAVDSGDHDLVRWLLARGASANSRAEALSGQTALHSAAWNGDLEMARLLVEAGADAGALDRQYQNTPRGWAETAILVTNNPECAALAAWLGALPTPT
jgi:ankyrin repeat protein